ncbi:MAG TPA: hypothetical protein PLE19_22000 [Planctomycetota bacterium]|nr:hypothetical protein [Planctomycetota bacterium]HRR82313.1 hypothetical protein [Planctomycetota bacterium]HRT97429.1 hypothetical protein [Planctomycetota bacterium]
MRWIPFVLVAVLGVMLQATLMRLAVLGDAFPDLLVALLVVFSVGAEPAEGFAAGAVLGLGRDLFTAEPLGLSLAVFAVLGWLMARRPGAGAGYAAAHAVLALLCSLAASGASVAAVVAQGGLLPLGLAARRAGLSALSTALLAALVGALVWRNARWFGLRRRSEFAGV